MQSLLDAGMLLLWVGLYLGGIAWLARYRRHRAYACASQSGGYRADKDMGLRLLVFFLGIGLLAAVYFVSRVAGGL